MNNGQQDTREQISSYLRRLGELLQSLDVGEIDNLIGILARARQEGRDIYICGNGGSAAAASHLACDLNKLASVGPGKRFRVHCLNDNVPTMLAYANDLGYGAIFVEQLKNVLRPDDLVIVISGSGNSENVRRAIEYANGAGALTIGLCGYRGGWLKEQAAHSVHVPIEDMQLVEDAHVAISHLITQIFHHSGGGQGSA